jgi:predicted nucleic acid-binding protein
MKELFDKFPKVGLEVKNLVLLDTCFIFDLLDKEHTLIPGHTYAFTSFNVEELLIVGHRLHKMKVRLRRFLKSNTFLIVETPVHIGDYEQEKEFVNSIDSELLKHIADPSDAVLLAVAIKTNSIVLTKDKHHLFTVELENYLRKYDLKVYKEIKDIK